jgi:hypothetical protein
MSIQWVLMPLFVHVAVLFLLPILMGGWKDPAAGDRSAQVWVHLPLLFYVLTILAQMTRMADLLFVLLAWVFVALQVLDALAMVYSRGPGRHAMLLPASALVLAVMWGVYIVRILLAI